MVCNFIKGKKADVALRDLEFSRKRIAKDVSKTVKSAISNELKIDQSIAHNGVCLTVVDLSGDLYTVTAVKETLDKSNLGLLKIGSKVNLERSVKIGERLDGHMVQGHVDQTGICQQIQEESG